MGNKLASQFFAENIGHLFIDFANKKFTSQDQFDLYWYKIFEEGCKIEKNQIKDAYCKGVNDADNYPMGEKIDWENYYNETYLK